MEFCGVKWVLALNICDLISKKGPHTTKLDAYLELLHIVQEVNDILYPGRAIRLLGYQIDFLYKMTEWQTIKGKQLIKLFCPKFSHT